MTFLEMKKKAISSIANKIKGFLRNASGTPPISLESCADTTAIDYKIYGACQINNLPEQYQLLDYIESTGTQYINTGYKLNYNNYSRIVLKIKDIQFPESGATCIFGAGKGSSANIIFLYANNDGTLGFRSTDSGYNDISIGNGCDLSDIILTIYSDGNIQLEHSGGVENYTYEVKPATPSLECFLFWANRPNETIQKSICKIKNFQIYDTTNVLNVNLIPCYRKSDNAIGMYNSITKTFSQNNDSVFVKGNILPSPNNPIEVQSVGELVTDETDANYGKYKIPVTARSKNLFDVSTSKGFVSSYGGIKNIITNNSITVSNTLDKEHTTTLTLGEFEAGTYYIGMTSDDDNFNNVVFANNKSQGKRVNNIFTFTGKSVVDVYYFIPAGITTTIENIQITKSNVVTDYEPYHEPITTNIYLDEPLRKVGDYADYLDFKNGMVVRNVAEIVMKREANNIYAKLPSVVRIASTHYGFSIKPASTMLSMLLPDIGVIWYGDAENIFHHNALSTAYYFSLSWNRLGLTYDGTNVYRTDDETQTALTDSQIINIAYDYITSLPEEDRKVYMILITPTETPIALPILPTFKGITTVYEVGTTQPSNMEAEYYSKKKS